MRKSGRPPAITKAVRAPVRGFTDPNSETATDTKVVAITSDLVLSSSKPEAEPKLIIPVKRNTDWMKKNTAQQPAAEKFGLQVMAPNRNKQNTSRVTGVTLMAEKKVDGGSDSDVDEDTYERVPIEEFGAAMLRGMGWTESPNDDDAIVHNGKRPSLLGLGATPRPKDTLPETSNMRRQPKRY